MKTSLRNRRMKERNGFIVALVKRAYNWRGSILLFVIMIMIMVAHAIFNNILSSSSSTDLSSFFHEEEKNADNANAPPAITVKKENSNEHEHEHEHEHEASPNNTDEPETSTADTTSIVVDVKQAESLFQSDYYDICIIGAGLSGSVIAEQYASQLGKTSLILEKRDHIGGNCYDYKDPDTNIRVNKYGAHLFHTNYHRVWDYLQQFSDWTPYEHRVLGRIGDKHVPIPVNIDTVNALFDLNITSTGQMNEWLAEEQQKYEHDPVNSEEMAMSRVGERLFNMIFKPYTIKQWAKTPKELGPEVTARIPVRNDWDNRYFPNDVFQALPTHGYTKIFGNMIMKNPLIEAHINIDYFDVRGELASKSMCGHTFFSGPIDAYFAQEGYDKLEYR